MARLLGWEVDGQRYEGESEAWADGEVSASDLRQLAGSRDCWDQAAMSATSARSTARTAAIPEVWRAVSEHGQTGSVDVIESDGRLFEMILASDVIRDGMGLELTEITPGVVTGAPVLEVFWHHDGGGFHFICHEAANLPFDVVERFVTTARAHLPSTTP